MFCNYIMYGIAGLHFLQSTIYTVFKQPSRTTLWRHKIYKIPEMFCMEKICWETKGNSPVASSQGQRRHGPANFLVVNRLSTASRVPWSGLNFPDTPCMKTNGLQSQKNVSVHWSAASNEERPSSRSYTGCRPCYGRWGGPLIMEGAPTRGSLKELSFRV